MDTLDRSSMTTSFRFALVPQQLASPFFEEASRGCIEQADKLGVECVYRGTELPDADGQADLVRWLVETGIDGIAVAVVDSTSANILEAIAFALNRGVPVVTFDADSAESGRLAHIGTDNFALGYHMGKLLNQVDPTGGYYGIVSSNDSNGKARVAGIRSRLRHSNWAEVSNSPADSLENDVVSLQRMRGFMEQSRKPKAIFSVGGWPMSDPGPWITFIEKHANLTTVVEGTLTHQLDLLKHGFVSGLVGQAPHQMGANSIDTLLAYKQNKSLPGENIETPFQEMIAVPSGLPQANINMNVLGNYIYMGFVLVAVSVILAISCIIWTYVHRKNRVVRASQPAFLMMIAAGVLALSLSIVPMSMDDGNFIEENSLEGRIACMSQVWFVALGFTTIFAALFSKTLRINMIFYNPSRFSKMAVGTTDVLGPFAVLVTADVAVLTLFTIQSPLEFVRLDHEGTDEWNRAISSYGVCQSSTQTWPYVSSLVLINASALFVALVQAFVARSIQSEFSESQYIAILIASFMQTIVVSVPVLLLIDKQPLASYVLKVGIVFLMSMVVLVCVFVPKMFTAHRVVALGQGRRSSVRISMHMISHDDILPDEHSGLTLPQSEPLRMVADKSPVACTQTTLDSDRRPLSLSPCRSPTRQQTNDD